MARLFGQEARQEGAQHVLFGGMRQDDADVRMQHRLRREEEFGHRRVLGRYPEGLERTVRIEVAVDGDAFLREVHLAVARVPRRESEHTARRDDNDGGEKVIGPQDRGYRAHGGDEADRPVPVVGAAVGEMGRCRPFDGLEFVTVHKKSIAPARGATR